MPTLSPLPLLAALLFHGMVTGRMLLVLPVLLLSLLAHFFEIHIKYSTLWAWGVAALGGFLGVVLSLAWDYPAGLFPQWGLSGVAGALVLLSAWLWTCQEKIAAWAVAFVVVILSGHAPLRAEILLPAGLLAVALGVALLGRFSWRILPRLGLLWLCCLLGTLLLGTQLHAAEGIAARLIIQFMQGELFASGLGSSFRVRLQPLSNVEASDRVVLEVSGRTPSRLRSAVMDLFDGEEWSASAGIQAAQQLERGPAEGRTELSLRQSFRQVIPAPPGIFEVDRRLAEQSRGGLFLGNATWGESRVLTGGGLDLKDPPGMETLFLPEDLRSALEPFRAELLPTEGLGAREQGERLQRYFLANFRYSLSSDLRGEGPPLVVLLREKRPAYCVYFASAMAALLRAEGRHARLVGGYLLDPPNALTGTTPVREKDAHAWVELWIPEEQRWGTFDPTPSLAVEEEASWLDTLREALEEGLAWQLLALSTHPAQRLQALLLSPPVLGILGLAMLWALYERIRAGSRETVNWKGPDGKALPILPLYRRYQKLLRRAGVKGNAAQTDTELLGLLKQRKGEQLAAMAQHFLEGYRQQRYGEEQAVDLEERLNKFEAEMDRS